MATKMKRLSLYLWTFILLVWAQLPGLSGYSCPYGHDCGFAPAPPGRAPPCALPGLTFCVHPEPYPESVIRQLVEAGQYDIRTLLSDESKDDFNARKKNPYPYGYGPNSLPHVDQISIVNEVFPNNYDKFHGHGYNHDIFSQKTPLQPPSPIEPSPYNINVFQASNFTKYNGFQGFNTAPGNYWTPQGQGYDTGYDKKVYRSNVNPGLGYNSQYNAQPNYNPNYDSTDWFRPASPVTQYNPVDWWKYVSPSRSDNADVTVERSISYPTRSSTVRHNSTALARGRKRRNAELVRAASKRKLTGAEALKIALGLASAESSAERPRRQTDNTEELCRVRTQFITPRAALNNKGAWKYVVNMPDNMTQLVKAEICASTECSGLCSVPLGYTTRCEQKYIQKRLVALESNGQNLYTDVFWIPSCCQCTIVAN
ncbi:protein spaetzle 5 [Plutella xylostella]|uniref:protein spaetzle 5 n=1 Tax=Plutella xylostella TaxID=51655 RepID=UPI0020327CA2|nr:protein spaetzle 5 [Plutella xylostella]